MGKKKTDGVDPQFAGGLVEPQELLAKRIALEATAQIFQDQAPCKTYMNEWLDAYNLTQAEHLVAYQTKLHKLPQSSMHPAHHVLSTMIQLTMAEQVMAAASGYLMQARVDVAHAVANLKGLCYAVMKEMAQTRTLSAFDIYEREWEAYTAKNVPESVILRKVKLETARKRAKKRRKSGRAKSDATIRAAGFYAAGGGVPGSTEVGDQETPGS